MENVSPGKLTVIIGGGITFLFSFLSWYTGYGSSAGGWSSDTLPGLFPLGPFVALFGLVAALAVALPAFANVNLPEKILDFSISQLVLVCGFFDVVVTISLIIGATHGSSAGFGLILCFLGSAAIVVGWALDFKGVGAKPASQQPGMSAQGYGVAQGYGAPGAPQAPSQQPLAPQGPPPAYPPQQQAPAPQAPPPGWQPPADQPTETQLPPNTGSF